MAQSAHDQKANMALSSTAQRLNLVGRHGYSSYASNPYSTRYYHNHSFSNVWFYSWLFANSWSHQQQTIANQNGFSQKTAKDLLANSKHITIDNKGEKEVVIVTKHQYDAIQIGDKVTIKNNQLYLNGQIMK